MSETFSFQAKGFPCQSCNGDGGWEDCVGHYCGEPSYRWFKCEACDGTGEQEFDWEPEDIEAHHDAAFDALCDSPTP